MSTELVDGLGESAIYLVPNKEGELVARAWHDGEVYRPTSVITSSGHARLLVLAQHLAINNLVKDVGYHQIIAGPVICENESRPVARPVFEREVLGTDLGHVQLWETESLFRKGAKVSQYV